MFENTKRSARAIRTIVNNTRNHKKRMKTIAEGEKQMLAAIDNAFNNIRKS